MINYGSHYLDDEDLKSVLKSLKSKQITQGYYVKSFESALAKKFKSKYCTVVNNGTSALYLAISSLKLREKSKIITTPITFAASATSIILNNNLPLLADINLNDYTIDPNYVETIIKKEKNVKAVVAVDYAGHPCDWEALKYLKLKYGIYLINDNCHAMGSKLNNDIGYASRFADIVTQSYHPVKNITTGEGGSILTNNKILFKFHQMERNHNIERNELLNKKFGNWIYSIDKPSFNFRISDINCALGHSQLKKLDKFVAKRRFLASNYDKFFSNDKYIITPKTKKNVFHSYHIYPLRVNFKNLKISKKKFFINLKKIGINLQVHYIPIYKLKFFKKFLKKIYHLNNSEVFYDQEVSIPIFYDLKVSQQKKIYGKILDSLKIK